MTHLQNVDIQCPYCGESIEILVDCSLADQQYIEDCSVCCRPMILSVSCDGDEVQAIQVRTEDD